MSSIDDLIKAENYRSNLRDKIKLVREEIKSLAVTDDIRNKIFRQFVEKERNSETYINSRDILQENYKLAQKYGLNVKHEDLIIKLIESKIDEFVNSKNINFSIEKLLSDLKFPFRIENFEGILKYLMEQLDNELKEIELLSEQMNNIKAESDFSVNHKNDKNNIKNKDKIDQVNKEKVNKLIKISNSFLGSIKDKSYINNNKHFKALEYELRDLYKQYVDSFLDKGSLLGDFDLFEKYLNKFDLKGKDKWYTNIRNISALRGDTSSFFEAAKHNNHNISSGDLYNLRLNLVREEEKERLISLYIIPTINKINQHNIEKSGAIKYEYKNIGKDYCLSLNEQDGFQKISDFPLSKIMDLKGNLEKEQENIEL